MISKVWILLGVGLAGALQSPAWPLTISPSRTQVQLEPGQKINTVLTVFNEAKDPVQVEVSQKDWFVLPANKKIKISDWMQIHGKRIFVLESQKTRRVKLTLRAPKDAEGELVGMTSFLYRGEEPSMVTPMISVSSYLAILGKQKAEGAITDLIVADMPDRLRILATVKNTGNIHVRPEGHLSVLAPNGDVIKELTIPDQQAPTYPGNERPYAAEDLTFRLKPGDYKARAAIASNGQILTAERDFKVTTDGKIHMGDKK